jgi:diguanylate cyclase (GGDEF)-like protein/PAS domain S-box-containing protein
MGDQPANVTTPVVNLDTDAGFRALVDLSPDAVFIIADDYHVFANSRGLDLFGAASIADLQSRPALEFMHPDFRATGRRRLSTLVQRRRSLEYVEEKVLRLDGTVVDIEAAGTPIVVDDRPAALVVVRDITVRKRAQAELQAAEHLLQAAFLHAPTAILITDSEGFILTANPALERLIERDASGLVGAACWDIVAEADRAAVEHTWRRLTSGAVEVADGEFRYRRQDASTGWVYGSAASLGDGRTYIVHLTDVTMAKVARQRLAHRATHDPLTGLPNRTVILDRLAGPHEDGAVLTLLFIDLDGFKVINDQYGHHTGDEVLAVVGQRLRGVVSARELVGRIGGDEFAVVLHGPDGPARGRIVSRDIETALQAPIATSAGELTIGVSIGTATTVTHDTPPTTLLAAADAAMYESKTVTGLAPWRARTAQTGPPESMMLLPQPPESQRCARCSATEAQTEAQDEAQDEAEARRGDESP